MNRKESIKELGRLIRKSRIAAQVKQDDLAPIHRTALSKYENGHRAPPRGQLFMLCERLHIDVRLAFELAGYTVRKTDINPPDDDQTGLNPVRTEFERLQRQMEAIVTRGESPPMHLQEQMAAVAIQTNEEDLLDRMGETVLEPAELYLVAERTKLLEPQVKGKIALWYELAARTTNTLSRRYPAALAGLGTADMVMGNFDQAEAHFLRAAESARQHNDIMLAKQMELHAIGARYRQGHPVPTLAAWPRSAYDSSARWRSYWWLVTHQDWDRHDWEALTTHLTQARRTFRETWNKALKLGLLGPEAALQAAMGREPQAMEALQIELPLPHRIVEWGAHLDSDLWWDYIQLQALHSAEKATTYWAVRILQWHNQGCTGWVRHAFCFRPQTLNWSTTPEALQLSIAGLFNYYSDVVRATAAQPGWVAPVGPRP